MMMNPSLWTASFRPLAVWVASVARLHPGATVTGATRTRQQEAEAVRRMAVDLIDRDPRFADELFAAASRHEGHPNDCSR